jgi:succinate dehydrogenase hydrophobic anchor subunit
LRTPKYGNRRERVHIESAGVAASHWLDTTFNVTRTAMNHDVTDSVAETVDDVVDDQPWVKTVARAGWVAKGAVYTLMGLTAFAIGRGKPSDDQASPEGAVAQVVSNPAGRFLLAVLSVGLILYSMWRLLSAALVRGNELKDWLNRVGYLFSAAFYAVLAFAAVRAVIRDAQPGDSNTIEDLSKTMLESPIGRWVLFLAGAVAFAVGLYFIVEKGFGKSFLDEMNLAKASKQERSAITAAGVIGWVGRGFVTAAVGFFVSKAAWEVDKEDARGFDRALREVATHEFGRYTVLAAGVALIAYGVFCIMSLRHQELD